MWKCMCEVARSFCCGHLIFFLFDHLTIKWLWDLMHSSTDDKINFTLCSDRGVADLKDSETDSSLLKRGQSQ